MKEPSLTMRAKVKPISHIPLAESSIVNDECFSKNGISESLTRCEAPFCDVKFPKSGMKMKPKRYCSNECKVIAWAFRKLREKLKGLTDDKIVRVIRNA